MTEDFHKLASHGRHAVGGDILFRTMMNSVSADPGDGIAGHNWLPGAGGGKRGDFVSTRMAQGVVDLLEPVQIGATPSVAAPVLETVPASRAARRRVH